MLRRCDLESLDLARNVVDIVEDLKAEDIVLLDLRPDAIIADFFVVCTGNSDRHLKALADRVREQVKERYKKVPFASDGTPGSGWLILDYGDVVVHLFAEEQRRYYDLEGLWQNVGNVLLSIQ